MPRKAKISVKQAIDAIKKFKDYLQDGVLPKYSSDFYKDLSKEVRGEWTPKDFYNSLRENRRDLCMRVFKELEITFDEKKEAVPINENFDVSHSSNESLENFGQHSDNDQIFSLNMSHSENSNIFDLLISNELYQQMKPTTRQYKDRNTIVLEPGVWADIVNDEFWRQFRLPCAYSFKKASVSLTEGNVFLSIKGQCKSKQCQSPFVAVAEREPCNGQDLLLRVKTYDTSQSVHETIKRQLRNYKRRVVGEQTVTEGASNMRRILAKNNLVLGDIEAPIVYKLDTLRKLKQETTDRKLGMTAEDAQHPVLALQTKKYTPPYVGGIHEIGLDPFYVTYYLPQQMHTYKEYCRLLKDSSVISMDATSSLVTNLALTKDISSPAIFIYEVVVNLVGTTMSVAQMLSAAQDTATILNFLNKWLAAGAPRPKEAVSDYGKAILGAMSMAFNSLTLKRYIALCFAALQNGSSPTRPTPTFIRVDVAHFINIWSKAKYFSSDKKAVKDFLIRCVALMVSCEDFKLFEEILLLTLTISIHQYEGDILGTSVPSPAKVARHRLNNYIAVASHDTMKVLPDESSEKVKLIHLKEKAKLRQSFLEEESESDITIERWISLLQAEAEKNNNVVASRANAYHLPGFYRHLLRLGKEFVLWSAVMTPHFKSSYVRATSSHCEGEFNELKNRILKNYERPMRVDKFFVIHFNALMSTALLVGSSIKSILMELQNKAVEKSAEVIHESEEVLEHLVHYEDCNIRGITNPFTEKNMKSKVTENTKQADESVLVSSDSESGFQHIENWRNKAQKIDPALTQNFEENILHPVGENQKDFQQKLVRKKKPSKYFRPYPEIQHTQKISSSNSKLKSFLKNGSLFRNPVHLNKRCIFLRNTCPFDSIIQVLAMYATQNEDYLQHLHKSSNQTCGFILEFIEHGSAHHVYVLRCLLLLNFADTSKTLLNQKVFDSESPKAIRTIDVETNIRSMWRFIMVNEPSLRRFKQCPDNHTVIEEISELCVNENIIRESGFQELYQVIQFYLNSQATPCSAPGCTLIAEETVHMNAHIFVELDIRNYKDESMTCAASDFPVYLTLADSEYRFV